MTYTGKLIYNDVSHSYWLDGTRSKSASKVAQIASDSFTIEQWQKRQVAIGMTLDKTLSERIAVDIDNREAVQKVCDDAANAAKANARANRGTQRHRVFELGLLGRQDQFITDQQIADWKVLERTLDAYGLEPIPDRVEQFVAWPEHGVVGRYDAYLNHQGRPVLVDLKGGINAVKYPHSTAVQLWLYRFAPHTSANVVKDGDKSTVTEWTTPPEGAAIDHAYVLYCDDHHDVGELWTIDLDAARTGALLALGIVDWRKTKNYGKQLAEQVAAPEPPLGEQPVAPDDAHEVRRQGLRTRYQTLNEPQQLAYCDLAVDPNDLDAIETALNQVNVEPFNIVIPPTPVRHLELVTPDEPPDEGLTVGDDDVKALHARFDKLPLDAQLWTGTLVAQGNNGHPFRIKDQPTVRRYEIYRGILALAEWDGSNNLDDVIRALVKLTTGDDSALFPTSEPGQLLGTLDAHQARVFAGFALDLAQDRYHAIVGEDGTLRLHAVV